MIDFHNHVLPNVDDGPRTLEESISMIRHAEAQGITDIVQTVHFQHPKMDGKNVDYKYLTNKLNDFQSIINKQKININMHLSAEVFYLPNLVEISSNPLVTIGSKRYMLIEFSTNIYPEGFEEVFYKLQLNGITPIIAHPERYRFVNNNLDILSKWIDLGYIIQIDAGSVIGQFGNKAKKNTLKMISEGYVHLIGSDAHNDKKRNFCIAPAYKSIEKNTSNIYVSNLKENAERILMGKDLKLVIPSKNKTSFLKRNITKLLNRL